MTPDRFVFHLKSLLPATAVAVAVAASPPGTWRVVIQPKGGERQSYTVAGMDALGGREAARRLREIGLAYAAAVAVPEPGSVGVTP